MIGSLKTFWKEWSGAEIILLLLVLIAVSFPLFSNLGFAALYRWDESRLAVNAMEMLNTGKSFVVQYGGYPDMWNTKPPLFIWMMTLSMKTFGVNEFAIRFPSAVSVIFVILAAIIFSKKFLHSIYPALLMALILSVSIGFTGYHAGRTGDFDAALSMAVFIAALFYFLFLQRGEKNDLFGFLFFLAIGIWIKGIAACLYLPVLLLLTFLFGKLRTLFKREYIFALIIFALFITLPYLIRELLNPGYLKAVYVNEIAGRYLEVKEGHSGSFTFYIMQMIQGDFYPWIYLILPMAGIAFWKGDEKLRSLISYLLILLLGYILILSFSQTKIQWYAAPLYPIMAFIVGLGLWKALAWIYQVLLPNRTVSIAFVLLVVLTIFYEQYHAAIVRSSQSNLKGHPELSYRDLIRDGNDLFPDQQTFIIPKFDYNSHTDFYTQLANRDRLRIKYRQVRAPFLKGDTVLYSEREVRDHINENFVRQIISDREGRSIAVIFGAFELADTMYTKLNSLVGCNNMNVLYSRYTDQISIILNDQDWTNLILEKASVNKSTFYTQLDQDGIYILRINEMINDEEKLCIEKMIVALSEKEK